ncbi:HlyD family secretion protein [Gluconobacter morbifer]|uniref:Secretion protein HlyD family protein n=1 Tax=Gluconobacter morbifer G707 TaxID=1088869 RepID=G6XLR5_9PROT|nr:HlyD family secretion protein [Gluconobacter morbifer]EHH67320.1 secretion protein HlyD family protein [Gluconobacter morbifer G707]
MADQTNDDDGKPNARWPFVLAAVIIVGFIAVVLAIIFVPSRRVWTDDAYVTAHYSTIAPRISGQVETVAVDDNQMVRTGQVLVTLDDRDYRTSVDQALATLDHDQALVMDAKAAVNRQPSLIQQAQANVARLRSQLVFARQNARRYGDLAKTGAGSTESNQQYTAQVGELEASVQGAQADAAATQAQLPILQARHEAALHTLDMDRARLHQAELNLSYTRVRAPFDGMVGERSVQAGNYVAPGAALMAVVPMDQLWIEANYRELALRHMRPGQPVVIHVDAYDIDLQGVVDSVPPASGAAFAPLAPENATGNFTKIVQRLPVKITVRPGQKLAALLRMGFSVETSVDTGFENVAADQQHTQTPVTAR